ncbi:MAG: PfkB family carbohydrate kinase [Firmicutes bacterium]|nr:PfkB family carbohydrate kinase [Bacillota bacterium]
MKLNIPIPSEKPFDAVGLGLNAVDNLIIVPGFPERNTKSPLNKVVVTGGGQIANAFSFLARIGMKVKYLGKFGDDENGRFSMDSLKSEGVDLLDAVVEDDCTNQYAYIIVDESTGERTIMWHRHPKLHFMPADFSKEAVTSGKILHLDGHEVPFSIQAAKWAQEEGIPVLVDAERLKEGTLDLLPLADVLIADEHFCRLLCPGMDYDQILHVMQERFSPRFCAITLGEKGSLGLFSDELIHMPAYQVPVLDTTGCGDVYHAAFVYGMVKEWEIPDIMKFASAAAALKCRNYGGRIGAPHLDEIEKLMKTGTFYPA